MKKPGCSCPTKSSALSVIRTANARNARQPSVEQPSAACARKLFMQYSMTSVGPMQSAPTSSGPNGGGIAVLLSATDTRARSEAKSSSSDGSCIDTETARCGATAGVVATATKPIAYLERSRLADNMG